jgi:tetratricopeptide (TPR) repeat protein
MLEQQSGREAEALGAYERAIEQVDDNAVILNNMAWLYLSRDPLRAQTLATRAYELAPTRAEIVDTYGWVLFKTGRRAEGLAALQQALVIAPRNAEIALHVAEALIEMNRAAEARPILQRVLRDSPGTDFARSATAMLGRIGG